MTQSQLSASIAWMCWVGEYQTIVFPRSHWGLLPIIHRVMQDHTRLSYFIHPYSVVRIWSFRSGLLRKIHVPRHARTLEGKGDFSRISIRWLGSLVFTTSVLRFSISPHQHFGPNRCIEPLISRPPLFLSPFPSAMPHYRIVVRQSTSFLPVRVRQGFQTARAIQWFSKIVHEANAHGLNRGDETKLISHRW